MTQTQQPRSVRVRPAGLMLMALAMSMPGCASIANWKAMKSIPVAGPKNPLVDVACIWQQGEGRDELGRPCRGFCGQLMFLTAASKTPGVVHGSATIYLFDNVGTVQEQAKPFKTYEFSPQQWATFERRTNLGMTYQLFIPYTRPGGHDADCQIHVKFNPAQGSPIFAHPETIALRGSSGPAAMADAIDRKLTSTSKLFRDPAVMKTEMSVDPAYVEMVRKMKVDAATPAATQPAAAAIPPVQKKAEIARLQALLDSSASKQVQQADYAQQEGRSQRVSQAVHEEEAVE